MSTLPKYTREDMISHFSFVPIEQASAFNEGMTKLQCISSAAQEPQSKITTTVDWEIIKKHIKELKKFQYENKKKQKAKLLEVKIKKMEEED